MTREGYIEVIVDKLWDEAFVSPATALSDVIEFIDTEGEMIDSFGFMGLPEEEAVKFSIYKKIMMSKILFPHLTIVYLFC